MQAYGVIADCHLHNWSAFSVSNERGVNSRLEMLLKEIARCGAEVKAAGGKVIYVAGDLFHVRGSIAPSVLNPTLDCFRDVMATGIEFRLLPGNHDLESKHTSRLSSAITALEGIGCKVCDTTTLFDDEVMCIPWIEKIDELKACLERINTYLFDGDVLIHAPIDGTLVGIPDHGISPEYLASLGFRRVMAGHYHQHRDFGRGIYSIGALAHHTWSDVGTKAGFLIVSDDGVKRYGSNAPEFIDLAAGIDPLEAALTVDGNYVRARIADSDMKSVAELRGLIEGWGARGVIIQAIKAPTTARKNGVTHSVSSGASVEASIAEFIKAKGFANAEQLQIECQNILAEVTA